MDETLDLEVLNHIAVHKLMVSPFVGPLGVPQNRFPQTGKCCKHCHFRHFRSVLVFFIAFPALKPTSVFFTLKVVIQKRRADTFYMLPIFLKNFKFDFSKKKNIFLILEITKNKFFLNISCNMAHFR